VRGRRIFLALATALVSVIFSAGARAQGLAPSTLGGDSRSNEVTNDVVQVITAKTEPAISKKTRKLLTESLRTSTGKSVRMAAKKADTSSREGTLASKLCDGTGAPDESTDRKSNGAAWQPFQLQISAG
jgi:hypothetical protein